MFPINVYELTTTTQKRVCNTTFPNQHLRKYYRFRYSSQFYGGIVTGDVVGCNLRCAYCWSQKTAWHPRKGSWYSVDQVVKALLNLTQKNQCQKIRLSGGEPTLCQDHLLGVLSQIPDHLTFILETNGICLSEEGYIQKLEELPNPPYVRVSLKAGQGLFSQVTGASLEAYQIQLQTIELLKHSKLLFNVAIMPDFITSAEVQQVADLIAPRRLEFEQLMVYPFVEAKLKAKGLYSLD